MKASAAAARPETQCSGVRRLVLTDFRNCARIKIEPDARPCVLTGPNGAGKTNILEAVSFLSPGRGLRRARAEDIGRRDNPADVSAQGRAWAVSAGVEGAVGAADLGVGARAVSGAQLGASERRRAVRINGADAPRQDVLAEHLAVTWLTPDMDRIFAGSASARRRFLDRLVYAFDPAHAGRVAAYEHAMRERLRVLRAAAPGRAAWLNALESAAAEKGVAVCAARTALAARLDAACRAAPGPFPAARAACEGEVEIWLSEGPALAAEDRVRERLAANRGVDAAQARAAFAPHRGDFTAAFAADGRPAGVCSTGEQKALLIALVLAHAELITAARGFAPVVLLDEIAAHLDEDRRAALFERLSNLGAQFWLTGADARVFEGMPAECARFAVAEGRVTPV
ncbi:MAG: DNA replication/repair protein RecF [Rhodospirillales bacterium]